MKTLHNIWTKFQANERREAVKIPGNDAPLPPHLLPLPQQDLQDDYNHDGEDSEEEEQDEPEKELPSNGPLVIGKPQVDISIQCI